MRIWKWSLDVTSSQTVELHAGAQIMSVQVQYERPQLWVLVDETQPKRPRRIDMYGTDATLPENPGVYLGTVQMNGGQLVLHVFEVPVTDELVTAGVMLEQA